MWADKEREGEGGVTMSILTAQFPSNSTFPSPTLFAPSLPRSPNDVLTNAVLACPRTPRAGTQTRADHFGVLFFCDNFNLIRMKPIQQGNSFENNVIGQHLVAVVWKNRQSPSRPSLRQLSG